jgi:hypothetical protein
MDPNTERPRRRELQLNGLVRDSGERRLNRSGRRAVVWEATEGPMALVRPLGKIPHTPIESVVDLDEHPSFCVRRQEHAKFEAERLIEQDRRFHVEYTDAGYVFTDSQKYIAGLSDTFLVDKSNPRVEVDIIPLEEDSDGQN